MKALSKLTLLCLISATAVMNASCGGKNDSKSSSNSSSGIYWDTNNANLNADNVTQGNFPATGLRVSFSGVTPSGMTCSSMPQSVGSFQQYCMVLASNRIDAGSMCDTKTHRDSLRAQKNCSQVGTTGPAIDRNGNVNINAVQNGFMYCQSELKTEVSTGLSWLFASGYAQRANAILVQLNDRGTKSFNVGSYQVSSKIMSAATERDNVQVEFKIKRGNELIGTFHTGLDQVGSVSINDEDSGKTLVVGCQYPNGSTDENLPEELNIKCTGSLKRDKQTREIPFSKDLTVDSTTEGELDLFSNQGGDEAIVIRYQNVNTAFSGLRKGAIILEASGIGTEKKREIIGGGTAASKQVLTFKEAETGYELNVSCAEARRSRVASDRERNTSLEN